MDSFLEKAKKFNVDWNDLPRRTLIVFATCVALIVAFAAFPYFAPFVCALAFSWIIHAPRGNQLAVREDRKFPRVWARCSRSSSCSAPSSRASRF